METLRCDHLIVGAGITGLTIAHELVQRGEGNIVILEKEDRPGFHASGRNSGILHAGIYYSPGTLKARFCAEGNRLMVDFCKARGLPLVHSGKVVVAKSASEVSELHRLHDLASESGLSTSLISSQELQAIEPHAVTHGVALHSPATATVAPESVVGCLAAELEASGRVAIHRATAYEGLEEQRVARTSMGRMRFGGFVNAAGAFADRIAHSFGVGLDYVILPFKGAYRRLIPQRNHLVRGNIYPVPDPRTPFLGVHLSRSVRGDVMVGPTALPAFGRSAYRLRDAHLKEGLRILSRDAMLMADPAFRTAALREPIKYLAGGMFRQARALVPSLRADDLKRSAKVGIRAQVVHWPQRRLEMDFVLLDSPFALHVLNAVSPAFTSSFAFARYAVDRYLREGSSD